MIVLDQPLRTRFVHVSSAAGQSRRAMAAAAAAHESPRRTPSGDVVDEQPGCEALSASDVVALDTWLDTLVAATRPETVWTAASVCAALEWAAQVEQLCCNTATEAAWAARVELCGGRALLVDPPTPRAARVCFLTALLRTQQLSHGRCVTPLLDALGDEQEESQGEVDCLLAGLVLPVIQLLLNRGGAGDTSSQLAEALQRVVLDESPCARCAANPPAHAPGDHLRSVAVIALAATVSAAIAPLPRDVAHAETMAHTAFGGLNPTQAVCAACLYLATRACGDGDEDSADAVDAACPATALLLQNQNNGGLATALRPLPPWLAALACDACPALCTAYVASLLTRPEDGQGAITARDGAQRLRCCIAAGPTARSAALTAMRAVGCWTHDAGSDALTE